MRRARSHLRQRRLAAGLRQLRAAVRRRDRGRSAGQRRAQNIYNGLTAANLNAFLYWWGSSTPTFNGDNESLIQVNGTTVAASGRLWAFATYSRLLATPYLTDDGDATAAQPPLPIIGGSFAAALPARSLVTYYIPAHR